jgi:hypothetical protein
VERQGPLTVTVSKTCPFARLAGFGDFGDLVYHPPIVSTGAFLARRIS